MILLAHPLGNANVRQAALAFAEADILERFFTCLNWPSHARLSRFLPARLTSQLERRAFPLPVRPHTRTAATLREAGRHAASRLNIRWLTRHESGACSVDGVFRAFDRQVARQVRRVDGLRAVYAYEDGALEIFRAAGERGLARLYDLPIGYWRAGQAIFAEEAERRPEWAGTLTGRADSEGKLARKDEELARADAIFVASTFTRETLRQAPACVCPPSAKVYVIPYGAPPAGAGEPPSSLARARKLRVLFVGSLGQRKGLAYLIEAVEKMAARVELTLLGAKTAAGCEPLERAIKVHRWIPSLPHGAVLEEMGRHDVLAFPSLFEGFGLVILEAMSRGLPVIATPNTAAPDVLSDGVEGFIVPIRSSNAIAEKLELLAADPARLAEMKQAARARAATLRWEDYRRRLAAAAVEEFAPL